MQKTKLGISVGLLGAAICFACLFSGYLVAIVLTGYVLLFEENEWLKKNAVKAVALLMLFSFLTTAIHLIPDAVEVIQSICALFDGHINAGGLLKLVNAVQGVIDILKTVLFLGLGFKALKQESVSAPVVDPLIEKYM